MLTHPHTKGDTAPRRGPLAGTPSLGTRTFPAERPSRSAAQAAAPGHCSLDEELRRRVRPGWHPVITVLCDVNEYPAELVGMVVGITREYSTPTGNLQSPFALVAGRLSEAQARAQLVGVGDNGALLRGREGNAENAGQHLVAAIVAQHTAQLTGT